jgi:hypothetical protein
MDGMITHDTPGQRILAAELCFGFKQGEPGRGPPLRRVTSLRRGPAAAGAALGTRQPGRTLGRVPGQNGSASGRALLSEFRQQVGWGIAGTGGRMQQPSWLARAQGCLGHAAA